MKKTKVEFAEPTIQYLENILHCYLEDYGYKYFHKLTQFITSFNSRRKCARLDNKECKEIQVFVHSVQQNTLKI